MRTGRGEASNMSEGTEERTSVSRRAFLRAGAIGATAVGLTAGKALVLPNLVDRGLWSPDGVMGAASIAWADSIYTEVMPTSPLILNPFSDELPIPDALTPRPDYKSWSNAPGPAAGQQT